MPLFLYIVLEILGMAIREQIKGIKTAKVELSLCVDGIIVYIENLKDTTRKFLSESGKVAAYKIKT